MIMKMFAYERLLELPPQLKWKYAREPELLGWTIQARNYSTFIANIAFTLMACLSAATMLWLYSVGDGVPNSSERHSV